MRKSVLLVAGMLSIVFAGAMAARSAPAAPPVLGGCPVLPADNIWNTPIDNLPVDANSAAYINTIGANDNVHADFGSGIWPDPGGFPIGIPYTTVLGTQPKVPVVFDYADESDPGPYPIPPNVPIEGDPNSGDRHILIVDRTDCVLYEMWDSRKVNGSWHAGSGAVFTLTLNAPLRPDGWTSADAAGLPILPGLVRYDEVAAGEIKHAIRFTSDNSTDAYIWPARHKAARNTQTGSPPMGLRVRLKASFAIDNRFSEPTKVILRAMKKYGLILADNGSSWYISGAPDERWNNAVLHELDVIVGADFEAVDVSSLMVDADSGQVLNDFTLGAAPPARVIDPGGLAVYQLSTGLHGYWGSPVTVTASSPSPSVTIGLSGLSVAVPGSVTLLVTDTHPIGSPPLWVTIPVTATGGSVTRVVRVGVLVAGLPVWLPIVRK